MRRWKEAAHADNICGLIAVITAFKDNFFQNIMRLKYARSHCALTACKPAVSTWMRQALMIRLTKEDLRFISFSVRVRGLVDSYSFVNFRYVYVGISNPVNKAFVKSN